MHGMVTEIVEDMASGLMHFMEERGYNKLDEFMDVH